MSEPLSSNDPGTQKRRSTRIVQAVPVTVTGVDALGQPFKERTTTTMVNCHGCKYTSKHYVPKNSKITLEVPRPETSQPARKVQGRVVWVQRPRTVRELFQIGLEFDVAGNVWGIAFPPNDWFPLPDEEGGARAGARPAAEQKAAITTPGPAVSAPVKAAREILEETLQAPAAPIARVPGAPSEPPLAQAEFAIKAPAVEPFARGPQPDESKIHVVPAAPPAVDQNQESQAVLARHMAKLVTDAKEALDKSLKHEAQSAINDEMTVVRQQLDAQLHDAVEKAIRISMERVSESAAKKVIQQAAERTNAIVEQARKVSETNAEQLDAKIRQAVQEAVGSAAEQAAREAAQQTLALNLKGDIEHAVDRAIVEREASSPSLQILSSPEAAQKQIEEWKKNLEATAQTVRQESIEKSQAEGAAAAQRWQADFEAALKGASQKLSDELSEVSQAALSKAEEDVVARNARLRAALDETLANAQETASSAVSRLAEERARADIAAAQLQDAAKSALERTSQQLENVVSEHLQDIGTKADQVIAERTLQIEPLVEKSAQRVVERVEQELNQSVSARLEEARKAVSDLGEARQQVEQFRESVRTEVQHASDQVARSHDTVSRLAEERARADIAATQLQDAVKSTLERTSQQLENVVSEHLQDIGTKADQVIAERTLQIEPLVEKSAQRVVERVEQELNQSVSARLEEARKAVSDLGEARQQVEQFRESVRTEVQHASDQVARSHDTVSRLAEERARADIAATQLQDAVKSTLERTSQQLENVVSEHLQDIGTKADQVIAERTLQIEPLVEKSAQRVVERVEQELNQSVSARLEEARKAVSDLGEARQQVEQFRESVRTEVQHASDQVARLHDTVREEILQASEQAFRIQNTVREQVGQASETVVQETLVRLKQETAKFPEQLEKSCSEVTSKLEADFEQKSTAIEHATYEALSKASEWYQKKAHTTMQTTLEKAVEQSTAALRDRAAEISSLVAAELDHYRRTYLEHSQAQIEEAAKELVERERTNLNETAEMANATFTDRAQRTTEESLRRMEQSSNNTLERTRSDMEFTREGALAEFQKNLGERILKSIEQARADLQAQLRPLMETVEADQLAQQKKLMEQIQRSGNESIEEYKARLENASNSWLLASATTLGQHSQVVLDTLAKAAEKRLRDTCRNVLAGMGDTLKERMLGISGEFNSEEDDEEPPAK